MLTPGRPVALTLMLPIALSLADCSEQAEPRKLDRARAAIVTQKPQHFDQALAIRDALIEGALEAVRQPARSLAREAVPAGLPEGAAPYVAELRAAAQAVVEARDRGTAARAISGLALACGNCHQGLSAGIELSVSAPPPPEPAPAPHMRRHLWAADRMWEGLVVPSHDAWARGVEVLADAPLHPEALSPAVPNYPRIEALAHRVHSLAEAGETAEDMTDRADIYAGLLATCARCHRLLAE